MNPACDESKHSHIVDVKIGKGTVVKDSVSLHGCEIGDDCKIDSFVYIESGVKIGNKCKVRAFAFIPEGVEIEDNVFIGPCVCFANDRHPRATTEDGRLKAASDWKMERTLVRKGASIGANATILGPVVIGENSMVGAGSVVTKDVAANQVVAGVPAKPIGSSDYGKTGE